MRAFFRDFSTPVCRHPRFRTHPAPRRLQPAAPPRPHGESSGDGGGGGSVFLITTAIFFSSRDDAAAKRYRNISPPINPAVPSCEPIVRLSSKAYRSIEYRDSIGQRRPRWTEKTWTDVEDSMPLVIGIVQSC